MTFTIKDGRIIRLKNSKLRIFRNNLRRMWLSLVVDRDNKMGIVPNALTDNSGKEPLFKNNDHILTYMNLKYSMVEVKRMGNCSICLCPVCLNYNKDMIWNSFSETWYCEGCYNKIFGNDINSITHKGDNK